MACVLRRSALLLTMALLALVQTGCAQPAYPPAGFERVKLDDRTYMLEIVADNESRTKGLGGRTHLDEDKGMLFVFPDSKVRHFVMRDCFFDIDIIYLDADARIVAMHQMKVEPPRGEDESDFVYNNRLKRYSSRFDSQFVIELAGGQLDHLDLEEGQAVKLDVKRLRSLAK